MCVAAEGRSGWIPGASVACARGHEGAAHTSMILKRCSGVNRVSNGIATL